jgi:surfeit locus 1 family protein
MLRNRSFRPALLPGVLAFAAIALTVSLGNWQSRRAEEKQALGQELDAAGRHAVLAMPSEPVDAHAYAFHRVSARGEYSARHTILLDNKVLRGVAGYHVLTPLKLSGGDTYVLVNRGWVAAGARRDSLPRIQTLGGTETVEGIAVVPGSHMLELDAKTEEGWCLRVMQTGRGSACSLSCCSKPVRLTMASCASGTDRTRGRTSIAATPFSGMHSPPRS